MDAVLLVLKTMKHNIIITALVAAITLTATAATYTESVSLYGTAAKAITIPAAKPQNGYALKQADMTLAASVSGTLLVLNPTGSMVPATETLYLGYVAPPFQATSSHITMWRYWAPGAMEGYVATHADTQQVSFSDKEDLKSFGKSTKFALTPTATVAGPLTCIPVIKGTAFYITVTYTYETAPTKKK